MSDRVPDDIIRCGWCTASREYMAYHDNEWGYPVDDDQRLFEKLCLESFQSGLSWRTILTKRDNFRLAFMDFDFNKMAEFTEYDVERLLQDAGIVRHRGKIEAVINNAKCAQALIQEAGSLAAFVWRFEPVAKVQSTFPIDNTEPISTSIESIALAKALKSKGWKFVGPTTVYAFMQAMGLVNDHVETCVYRARIEKIRQQFIRPG
ncbi:MAG: DNA-3-methyladenine glycosylase I [Pseudomonadales bacterium]|nr:DNA-3-methyladenine glycosylase I [Pseudomonadales bacterium]